MKKVLIINVLLMFAVLASLGCYSASRTGEQSTAMKDSITRAEIDIAPKVLTVIMDSTSWVMKQVQVLNRGGSALHISRVNSSCGCANGTVMVNPVQPMEVGKLLIRINTQNMKDSVNTIEFSVESDASNSPFLYRVQVVNPSFRDRN